MVFWVIDMVNFWKSALAILMVAQVAIGMGLWLSAMCENIVTASEFANVLSLPAILFGGLFANSSSMPAWLSWLEYTSPIFYSN